MLQKSGVQLVAEGYTQYLAQMREVNKAHKEAFSDKPIKEHDKAHKNTQNEVKKTKGVMANLKQAMLALGSGDVIGTIKSLKAAFLEAKGGAIALLTAIGAMKLINFTKQAVDVAARNEELAVSLENVGKQVGYTAGQIAYATELVKNQGITTKAARQSLLQMAQANIGWAQAAELANTAQSAAVIGQLNSSEAFERMITGIQRGEVEILKTIGLNVNFEQAYKRTAKQLGKNTKELTEQEKVQARANEVLRAGANISGVYDAAMTTAGKQQRSLARHIEETQNNLGQMFLGIKSASIAMQTDFWKGAESATRGLKNWGAALISVIGLLDDLGSASKESANANMSVGKALHNMGRTLVQLVVLARAAVAGIKGAFSEIPDYLDQTISPALRRAVQFGFAMSTNDIEGAKKALGELLKTTGKDYEKTQGEKGKTVGEAFTSAYIDSMTQQLAELNKSFPDLFKDWEDLGKVAKTDLDLTNQAVDRAIAELQRYKSALEQSAKALEQVESIQRDYQRSLDDAAKSYNKNFNKLIKEFEKSKVKLREKTDKELAKLDIDAGKERAKIIEEENYKRVQDARKLYKDLEQERRRFELDQLQSMRRFKLSERRLQAEGDVLGLQQLREDFDLQKQEAKENFDLQQKETKDSVEEQQRQQQEDLQRRLQELEESVRERRQEVMDSYQDELNDLVESNVERKAEMQAAYQEQLQDLRDNRDRQLEELARGLQQEGTVTEEGMKVIADKIAEVFGDQGIADLLMQAWAERSTTAVAQAMQDIQAQIEAVDAQITALQTGEAAPQVTQATRSIGTRARRPRRGRGMRTGGIGVVTGPALYEVEPGVQEIVAFAPVRSAPTSGRLDVNVGGGIDVRGAEAASPYIVDAAVEQFMNELGIAVRRMAKR